MSENNTSKVQLTTSEGNIIIELYPEKAPITVDNFLNYVNSGFYNGTIFHRVIAGFMIQGGGFTPDMEEKDSKNPPIKNEATNGLENLAGTIAMARTNVVDSATSQFFINTVDNPHLNHVSTTASGFGYCVFGKVVEGFDIVQKIEAVETGYVGYFSDVPEDMILIEKVEVI